MNKNTRKKTKRRLRSRSGSEKKIKENEGLDRLFVQIASREKFVLILGAGCSISCGLPNFDNLKRLLIPQLKGDVFRRKPSDPIHLEEFENLWAATGTEFRQTIMYNVVPERPLHLKAYYSLAHMIKSKYFSKIINYNFDNYLEIALHSIGLDWFLTLVNGCNDIDYIRKAFKNDKKPVILKTHGDYKHGVFSLSRQEMIDYSERIRDIMTESTRGKIIIIGYSGLDYPFMRAIDLDNEGQEIWYVNPSKPPNYLMDIMARRRSENNWIQLTFDQFFHSIYGKLKKFGVPKTLHKSERKSLRGSGYSYEIEITNKLGLHARACAKLSHLANNFMSEIWLIHKGDRTNAKSLLGILMLAASIGSILTIEVYGEDEDEALDAIVSLINRKFDEEN